jgi:hypothetical protein
MDTKTCADCSMREKYDRKSKSFAGRFWRWHIGFCPGWKKYFNSLSGTERYEISVKYHLKK